MCQQISDGDLVDPRISEATGTRAYVGDECECVRVQVELAVLDQLHDGGGGNGLSDTSESEDRFRQHGLVLFHVGESVAACEDELAIPGDGERSSRQRVSLHKPAERTLNLFETRRSIRRVAWGTGEQEEG